MPLSLICAEAAAALRSMQIASRKLFMTSTLPARSANGEHAATRPVDPIRVGSGRVSCHSDKIQTDATAVRPCWLTIQPSHLGVLVAKACRRVRGPSHVDGLPRCPVPNRAAAVSVSVERGLARSGHESGSSYP